MNIWTLFVKQVQNSYPGRELVKVTLVLDVREAIMKGESTDTQGVTLPAKEAKANRAIIAMFINAHKATIPNINTVGLEFDMKARTVEITAIGKNGQGPIKGTSIEKF